MVDADVSHVLGIGRVHEVVGCDACHRGLCSEVLGYGACHDVVGLVGRYCDKQVARSGACLAQCGERGWVAHHRHEVVVRIEHSKSLGVLIY